MFSTSQADLTSVVVIENLAGEQSNTKHDKNKKISNVNCLRVFGNGAADSDFGGC